METGKNRFQGVCFEQLEKENLHLLKRKLGEKWLWGERSVIHFKPVKFEILIRL